MKNECSPGSTAWKVWMDLFNFWKEAGDPETDHDWMVFHDKAVELDLKYSEDEHDLCLALLLAVSDVAEKRWKDRRKE